MKYQSHLALDELDLPPSTEWAPPNPCWCFVHVTEGQGYWLGEGAAREAGNGDVLVLPPIRQGHFRVSQLGATRLHFFRFCPELMSGLLTMAERHYFDRLASKGLQPLRFLPANHPLAKQFSALCARAGTENGLLLRCHLLELIGMIFARELMPEVKPEAATLSATKRIRVLLEHLTEEEFLNASSEELASYCGCSLRHFSRLFLQHFGISLRSRQMDMRLSKARRLLAETDSRVLTVAATCGYRHLGVFNSLFKKRFGMTPSEWRRAAGKDSNVNGACGTPALTTSTQKNVRKSPAGNGSVVTEK